MYSNDRLPVQTNPQPRPIKRHHTAQYYAHRVHESLTTRFFKVICSIFLGLLFIVGILSFILWLSLRPHRPRFHVRNFSVPGLNQPNGFENAEITFNITARNPNQNMGIYYDSMEGSVYFQDQKMGTIPLLFPFYQEPKNTTVVYGTLSGATLTVNNNRWMEFTADLAKGSVVFRLELKSTIRFKIATWSSRHHRVHTNCQVAVGQDGQILAISKDKRCPVYFT